MKDLHIMLLLLHCKLMASGAMAPLCGRLCMRTVWARRICDLVLLRHTVSSPWTAVR